MIFFRLIKEGFLFAYQSIIVNKLRTFLSLLGITIGIFAIIAVFTVLDWMEKSVKDSIESLGDNVVYVQKFPWSMNFDLAWWDIIRWPNPNVEEYEALRRESSRAGAACFLFYTTRRLEYKNNSIEEVPIFNVTEGFEDIRSFEIASGRYFSPFEANSGRAITILGATVAEELFQDEDPLGREIEMRGYKLQVVGVLKKEGQGAMGDQGLDGVIILPWEFSRKLFSINSFMAETQIWVKAREGVSMEELKDDITMIMRKERRLRPNEENNFSLNQASLLTQGFEAVFRGINFGGAIIGLFSILVGGFGIANIMFVSVKERTNIIGIQKALGAKRNFILQQFLYESVLLSMLGGILGLLLVFAGTLILNRTADLNVSMTLGNIIRGLVISGVIGVISGLAPARAASRMDPVEAIGTVF